MRLLKIFGKAQGIFISKDGFIEKRLSTGMGIRFKQNYQFKGFVD